MSGWLLYPFTLGLVAAVNPCGFPLLPIYLSLFIEGNDSVAASSLTRVRRGLSAGLYATAGFVLVFGIVGLLTEAGLTGTADVATSWARYPLALLGILLVAYGIATIAGRSLNLHLPQIRPGLAQRRPLAIGLFGVSYAVASLGCSLPIFIGGVATTFTHRGIAYGIKTFVAYAVGMGLLLTVVALVMSLTGVATARRFRVLSRFVAPIGGLIVVAVGAYVALYWISDIINPTNSTPVVRFIQSVQGHVATYLQAHASMLGAIFGVVLVGGTLMIVLIDRPRHSRKMRSERV